MTTERDFDRLARAWLELGPDEAPDRVVAAVLQAAETTPQVRRRVGWPTWRSFHMTRLPIVATVVAALVVVIGGGFLLTRGTNQSVGGPQGSSISSPSPSPSPGASPGTIPTDLRYMWLGEPSAALALGPEYMAAALTFNPRFDQLTYESGDARLFPSTIASAGPDRLVLVSTDPAGGCQVGDRGTYSWATTQDGTILTTTLVDEACAVRGQVIPARWERAACTDQNSPCLGNLGAGKYSSLNFRPDTPAGATWGERYGELTYTVPAGWAAANDAPHSYDIVPQDWYAANSGMTADTDGIYVLARPAAAAQSQTQPATNCLNAEAEGVGHTVDALVAWVVGHPGLDAGEPQPITINGRSGQMIDVKQAPDWTSTCKDFPGEAPLALVFSEVGGGNYSWGIGPDQQDRIILLDIGGGQVVLIDVSTNQPGAFDALVADAMPIIQSFTFK
jgi:hypothetical protein